MKGMRWGLFGFILLAVGCSDPALIPSGVRLPGNLSPLFPHSDNFASPDLHGAHVLAGGVEQCFACHARDTEDPNSPPSCTSCHADYPHPPAAEWIPYNGGHGEHIQVDYGGSTLECQKCHGADFATALNGQTCLTCHPSYPHSDGWSDFTGHGQYGIEQTIEGCKLCHGDDYQGGERNNPSCYSCHTLYPHQNGWVDPTGHGAYVAINDAEECKACHGTNLDGGTSGVSCNTCHAGGGTCLGCHQMAQDNGDGVPVGGRRPVTPEFPEGVAGEHAHHSGALQNSDCLVCHDQTTHKDGYVDLIDPDDGSLYTFVHAADLASDPDVSNFCSNCHDSDGAARLAEPLNPFGNGNIPPDVASKFQGTLQWNEWYGDWCFGYEGTTRPVNSHHDISDADQAFSGAKIECLSCHGSHNVSAASPLANPFDTALTWSGDITQFCLSCHAGGTPSAPGMPSTVAYPAITVDANGKPCTAPGADCASGSTAVSGLRGIESCDYTNEPWYVEYTWTHEAHGLDSKRGWQGYSGAPGADISCVVCHDPHGSYSATNTLGNPYMIRDVVDGTAFVDDGVRPGAQWTGPEWTTFGIVNSDVIVPVNGTSVEWGEFCGTCHSNWLSAYSWHSDCTGCQTCHGHGQAWGATDFVNYDADTSCSELP